MIAGWTEPDIDAEEAVGRLAARVGYSVERGAIVSVPS